MVTVTVGRAADKHGGHHEWASHADHAHDVVQHAVMSPFLQRFFLGLRETIIGDPGEVLAHSVVPVGLKQLLGPHLAERVEVVVAHDVLASFATI